MVYPLLSLMRDQVLEAVGFRRETRRFLPQRCQGTGYTYMQVFGTSEAFIGINTWPSTIRRWMIASLEQFKSSWRAYINLLSLQQTLHGWRLLWLYALQLTQTFLNSKYRLNKRRLSTRLCTEQCHLQLQLVDFTHTQKSHNY